MLARGTPARAWEGHYQESLPDGDVSPSASTCCVCRRRSRMARASTEAMSVLSSPSELGASSGRGGGSQPERRLAAARDLRLILRSCEQWRGTQRVRRSG